MLYNGAKKAGDGKGRLRMKSDTLDMSLLLDFYGDMLTFRQKEMLELYYDEDLSLSEIAEHAGITRQGVRDAIKRAEAQLHHMEEKIGLVARFSRIRQMLGEVREQAERIAEENRRGCYSDQIGRAANRISELAEELSRE